MSEDSAYNALYNNTLHNPNILFEVTDGINTSQLIPGRIREGYCCGCGDCCDPKFTEAREQAYRDAGVAFLKVNCDGEDGCSKWNPETRKCMDYENRPETCRVFPWSPLDLVALPNCKVRK